MKRKTVFNYLMVFMLFCLIFANSCDKKDAPAGTSALVATLSTSTISDITTISVVGGGTITFDGGVDVIERGICWGTTTNPTVADAKAVIGDLTLLKVFAGTTMTPLLIKIRMVHYITRIQLFQVSSVR